MVKRARHKQTTARSRPTSTVCIASGIALAAALGIGVRSDNEQALVTAAARDAASDVDEHALPAVDVYKSRTCGCCSKWVEHLREHGFSVRTTDTEELASVKASHGVPRHVHSCHTAVVDGYVIEGHVPAADVQRLLRERPAMTGLAVAGMPVGSPGMEVADGRTEPYDVLAFDRSGTTRVFVTHR
jgi:hypothetical protein